ncbi:MucR family transcriptional regulator [Goekera deserti]|uniref:MucR family transcriptional regulator n=1 Tax=Goekera deserti TaxID=2497753 RepID=A0A7K3WJ90_9ACTN|nr:MucR family transcriptional regulator [Goekera deserti]NDI48833.1 MucR family transcriptional regulator [Goekera deserti]NEL56514.1 MucR family transcriptional regulator [Goekera deserti]
MLHPVGDLPASVYWRRRALLLAVVLVLLAGLAWLLTSVTGGEPEVTAAPAGASSSASPSDTPALEQVLPSLASVQVPTAQTGSTAAPDTGAPAPTTEPPPPAAPGPCGDDALTVDVAPTPAQAPVGSRPTFELVVTNTGSVPCVRSLDGGVQEIQMFDSSGQRVWGSNDCFPESTSDTRTLAPGEAVRLPLTWSGLSSAPGCSSARVTLPAGQYVLRGRLDTKTGADAAFSLV